MYELHWTIFLILTSLISVEPGKPPHFDLADKSNYLKNYEKLKKQVQYRKERVFYMADECFVKFSWLFIRFHRCWLKLLLLKVFLVEIKISASFTLQVKITDEFNLNFYMCLIHYRSLNRVRQHNFLIPKGNKTRYKNQKDFYFVSYWNYILKVLFHTVLKIISVRWRPPIVYTLHIPISGVCHHPH